MNYFYISGTSRGIGKALAEEILKNDNNYVIGFARSNSIRHKHFEFIEIDLIRPEKVMEFRFIPIMDAERITLVNNAGMIGQVEHVGLIDNQSITDVFHLNLNSPTILMNNFVKAYQTFPCPKVVLNISSGASKMPVESWGAYCASKSALDMFTSVSALEQEKMMQNYPVRFFSIAPGIVDTMMQDEIRKIDRVSFSEVDKFIWYKSENKLAKPEDIAKKLMQVIENAEKIEGTIFDLREISL